jgi:rare lipoprotein A (peptidoglycan hydrolase)
VAAAGSGVLVQRQAPTGWATVTRTVAAADGRFVARWRPDQLGRSVLRAVPDTGTDTTGTSAQAASGDPTAQVTVYRPATATWYGPGFYGHRTACGVRLTRTLLGVANRSLPCGTMVDVLYHGRTVTVPVIDRGPFTRRARWDLTAAAAQQLGMTVTSRIGAVRVEQPA